MKREDFARSAFLVAAVVAYVATMLLAGCTRPSPADLEAAKDVATGVAQTIGGPWGAVAVAGLALVGRFIERRRLISAHADDIATERRRSAAQIATVVQSLNPSAPVAARYPASDQLPNGDGLVPHG